MQMRKTNAAARLPVRAVICTIAVSLGVAARTTPAATDHPFPSKPITLIVPGGSGGALDLTARALAGEASKTLGQPFIVDLKPGGPQTLEPATMAASAKPDGHTISLTVSTIVRVPLMQRVTFDPLSDFTYILQLCAVTVGVVTASQQPFQTLADAVAYAKANPGKLTYGSPRVGSSAHFGMEHIAQVAGVSMTHVPFRGAQEGIAAALGGHIMLYVSASEWKPQVAAGQMRLLAVYSDERRDSWPDVPTLKELGYATPLAAGTFSIAGPKGMDTAAAAKLHNAFKAALDMPAVGQILARHELISSYAGPDEVRKVLEQLARRKGDDRAIGFASQGLTALRASHSNQPRVPYRGDMP